MLGSVHSSVAAHTDLNVYDFMNNGLGTHFGSQFQRLANAVSGRHQVMAQVFGPVTHMEDLHRVPDFQLWTHPALAVAGLWEVNQWTGALSLLFLCL